MCSSIIRGLWTGPSSRLGAHLSPTGALFPTGVEALGVQVPSPLSWALRSSSRHPMEVKERLSIYLDTEMQRGSLEGW
jgi:hypothetical protein